MPHDEQRKLRALAARFGFDLRTVFTWAVRAEKYELEQALALAEGADLKPQFVWRLTRPLHNNN